MRVVLDTNVLVSAMLSSRGAPSHIVRAWEPSLLIVVVCPELVAEIREVTEQPFFRERLVSGLVERLVAGLRDLALWFHQLPAAKEPAGPGPKDNFLLGLAEASQADFLVTGDNGLLRLRKYKSTRVVTPAALIEFLKSPGRHQAGDAAAS